MHFVTSPDGTRIAYEQTGSGAPVILVLGAFNDHATGAPLAAALSASFTVYSYDRRGRGESGDTLPYAVEREVEDLGALIAAAGGAADVFGYSSGAVLALKAVALGLPVRKLALYDAPLALGDAGPSGGAGPDPSDDDGGRAGASGELAKELDELVSTGRRGEAVELFQTRAVGIPADVVAQLRHAPFRPALEAMAHTTVYDVLITGDPSVPAALPSIAVPTLVMAGGAGPEFMRAAAGAIAAAVPSGQSRVLAGQTHDIAPGVVAPLLREFFTPA